MGKLTESRRLRREIVSRFEELSDDSDSIDVHLLAMRELVDRIEEEEAELEEAKSRARDVAGVEGGGSDTEYEGSLGSSDVENKYRDGSFGKKRSSGEHPW